VRGVFLRLHNNPGCSHVCRHCWLQCHTMPARTHTAPRFRAVLALLGVLGLLTLPGCSTIKFAYNNVDWLLLDKADHYFDLNSEQEARARQLVAARMKVHRREELPIYVATLKEVRVMLADNLTAEEISMLTEQIPAVYRRTMGDTIPGIVSLLVDLDDAQIDHLQTRFEERNREFEENFMPESVRVRRERRVERSIAMVEFFIGPLRPEQVELIALRRNAMPLTANDWLAYHQSRQQQLLALLRNRASGAQLQRLLFAWWVELADQPPALARKMRLNTQAWSQMMLALDASLDERQRQNLLDKLDQFIEAFEELISEQATALGVDGFETSPLIQGVVSSRIRLDVSQRPPPRAWICA
jgi:hypothetical protein